MRIAMMLHSLSVEYRDFVRLAISATSRDICDVRDIRDTSATQHSRMCSLECLCARHDSWFTVRGLARDFCSWS